MGRSWTQKEQRRVTEKERGACLSRGYDLSDTFLGGGAVGRVFLAKASSEAIASNDKLRLIHQPGQDLNVAIKIIYSDIGVVNVHKLAKYIPSEIGNMNKAFGHPNIIMLLDVFVSCKRVFLVTELAANGSLKKFYRDHVITNTSKPYMDEDEARYYFREIVYGICDLHNQNIAHRDLKLDNILLTETGQVKLGDFGFSIKLPTWDARRENVIEMSRDMVNSTLCGTPSFMAPEVLRCFGGYNAIYADLWSLGVILYILVNGYYPFPGKTVKDVLHQFEKSRSKEMIFRENLSSECQDLIKRLLEYNSWERLSSFSILHHPWFQGPVMKLGKPLVSNNIQEELAAIKKDPIYEFQVKYVRSYLLQRANILTSQQKIITANKAIPKKIAREFGVSIPLPRREGTDDSLTGEIWRLQGFMIAIDKDLNIDDNLVLDPNYGMSLGCKWASHDEESKFGLCSVRRVIYKVPLLNRWCQVRDNNNPPLTEMQKCIQLCNTVDLDAEKPWPLPDPIPRPMYEWGKLSNSWNRGQFPTLFNTTELDGIKMIIQPITDPFIDPSKVLVRYVPVPPKEIPLDDVYFGPTSPPVEASTPVVPKLSLEECKVSPPSSSQFTFNYSAEKSPEIDETKLSLSQRSRLPVHSSRKIIEKMQKRREAEELRKKTLPSCAFYTPRGVKPKPKVEVEPLDLSRVLHRPDRGSTKIPTPRQTWLHDKYPSDRSTPRDDSHGVAGFIKDCQSHNRCRSDSRDREDSPSSTAPLLSRSSSIEPVKEKGRSSSALSLFLCGGRAMSEKKTKKKKRRSSSTRTGEKSMKRVNSLSSLSSKDPTEKVQLNSHLVDMNASEAVKRDDFKPTRIPKLALHEGSRNAQNKKKSTLDEDMKHGDNIDSSNKSTPRKKTRKELADPEEFNMMDFKVSCEDIRKVKSDIQHSPTRCDSPSNISRRSFSCDDLESSRDSPKEEAKNLSIFEKLKTKITNFFGRKRPMKQDNDQQQPQNKKTCEVAETSTTLPLLGSSDDSHSQALKKEATIIQTVETMTDKPDMALTAKKLNAVSECVTADITAKINEMNNDAEVVQIGRKRDFKEYCTSQPSLGAGESVITNKKPHSNSDASLISFLALDAPKVDKVSAEELQLNIENWLSNMPSESTLDLNTTDSETSKASTLAKEQNTPEGSLTKTLLQDPTSPQGLQVQNDGPSLYTPRTDEIVSLLREEAEIENLSFGSFARDRANKSPSVGIAYNAPQTDIYSNYVGFQCSSNISSSRSLLDVCMGNQQESLISTNRSQLRRSVSWMTFLNTNLDASVSASIQESFKKQFPGAKPLFGEDSLAFIRNDKIITDYQWLAELSDASNDPNTSDINAALEKNQLHLLSPTITETVKTTIISEQSIGGKGMNENDLTSQPLLKNENSDRDAKALCNLNANEICMDEASSQVQSLNAMSQIEVRSDQAGSVSIAPRNKIENSQIEGIAAETIPGSLNCSVKDFIAESATVQQIGTAELVNANSIKAKITPRNILSPSCDTVESSSQRCMSWLTLSETSTFIGSFNEEKKERAFEKYGFKEDSLAFMRNDKIITNNEWLVDLSTSNSYVSQMRPEIEEPQADGGYYLTQSNVNTDVVKATELMPERNNNSLLSSMSPTPLTQTTFAKSQFDIGKSNGSTTFRHVYENSAANEKLLTANFKEDANKKELTTLENSNSNESIKKKRKAKNKQKSAAELITAIANAGDNSRSSVSEKSSSTSVSNGSLLDLLHFRDELRSCMHAWNEGLSNNFGAKKAETNQSSSSEESSIVEEKENAEVSAPNQQANATTYQFFTSDQQYSVSQMSSDPCHSCELEHTLVKETDENAKESLTTARLVSLSQQRKDFCYSQDYDHSFTEQTPENANTPLTAVRKKLMSELKLHLSQTNIREQHSFAEAAGENASESLTAFPAKPASPLLLDISHFSDCKEHDFTKQTPVDANIPLTAVQAKAASPLQLDISRFSDNEEHNFNEQAPENANTSLTAVHKKLMSELKLHHSQTNIREQHSFAEPTKENACKSLTAIQVNQASPLQLDVSHFSDCEEHNFTEQAPESANTSLTAVHKKLMSELKLHHSQTNDRKQHSFAEAAGENASESLTAIQAKAASPLQLDISHFSDYEEHNFTEQAPESANTSLTAVHKKLMSELKLHLSQSNIRKQDSFAEATKENARESLTAVQVNPASPFQLDISHFSDYEEHNFTEQAHENASESLTGVHKKLMSELKLRLSQSNIRKQHSFAEAAGENASESLIAIQAKPVSQFQLDVSRFSDCEGHNFTEQPLENANSSLTAIQVKPIPQLQLDLSHSSSYDQCNFAEQADDDKVTTTFQSKDVPYSHNDHCHSCEHSFTHGLSTYRSDCAGCLADAYEFNSEEYEEEDSGGLVGILKFRAAMKYYQNSWKKDSTSASKLASTSEKLSLRSGPDKDASSMITPHTDEKRCLDRASSSFLEQGGCNNFPSKINMDKKSINEDVFSSDNVYRKAFDTMFDDFDVENKATTKKVEESKELLSPLHYDGNAAMIMTNEEKSNEDDSSTFSKLFNNNLLNLSGLQNDVNSTDSKEVLQKSLQPTFNIKHYASSVLPPNTDRKDTNVSRIPSSDYLCQEPITDGGKSAEVKHKFNLNNELLTLSPTINDSKFVVDANNKGSGKDAAIADSHLLDNSDSSLHSIILSQENLLERHATNVEAVQQKKVMKNYSQFLNSGVNIPSTTGSYGSKDNNFQQICKADAIAVEDKNSSNLTSKTANVNTTGIPRYSNVASKVLVGPNKPELSNHSTQTLSYCETAQSPKRENTKSKLKAECVSSCNKATQSDNFLKLGNDIAIQTENDKPAMKNASTYPKDAYNNAAGLLNKQEKKKTALHRGTQVNHMPSLKRKKRKRPRQPSQGGPNVTTKLCSEEKKELEVIDLILDILKKEQERRIRHYAHSGEGEHVDEKQSLDWFKKVLVNQKLTTLQKHQKETCTKSVQTETNCYSDIKEIEQRVQCKAISNKKQTTLKKKNSLSSQIEGPVKPICSPYTIANLHAVAADSSRKQIQKQSGENEHFQPRKMFDSRQEGEYLRNNGLQNVNRSQSFVSSITNQPAATDSHAAKNLLMSNDMVLLNKAFESVEKKISALETNKPLFKGTPTVPSSFIQNQANDTEGNIHSANTQNTHEKLNNSDSLSAFSQHVNNRDAFSCSQGWSTSTKKMNDVSNIHMHFSNKVAVTTTQTNCGLTIHIDSKEPTFDPPASQNYLYEAGESRMKNIYSSNIPEARFQRSSSPTKLNFPRSFKTASDDFYPYSPRSSVQPSHLLESDDFVSYTMTPRVNKQITDTNFENSSDSNGMATPHRSVSFLETRVKSLADFMQKVKRVRKYFIKRYGRGRHQYREEMEERNNAANYSCSRECSELPEQISKAYYRM